jgi:hypothetical protein
MIPKDESDFPRNNAYPQSNVRVCVDEREGEGEGKCLYR